MAATTQSPFLLPFCPLSSALCFCLAFIQTISVSIAKKMHKINVISCIIFENKLLLQNQIDNPQQY